MMKKLNAFLQQPAPVGQKPWLIIVAVTLIVFFLLSMLVNVSESAMRWKVITGFTAVTAAVTALWAYGFPAIFKHFYSPQNWVLWKMLVNNLIIIMLITIGNVLFHFYLFDVPEGKGFAVFLSYIYLTSLIGLLPATVATLIVSNSALKRNLQESRGMNEQLHARASVSDTTPPTPSMPAEKITLSGSTRETVEISPDDLLYIEASANYLLINYLLDGKVKEKQIRSTIARQEEALAAYPYIIRCHRAFIVNTSYIKGFNGNAQGLQLTLDHSSATIPVSRSYIPVIRGVLGN